MRLLLPFAILIFSAPLFAQQARSKSRLLYGFEQPADVTKLLEGAENANLIAVRDNGVTEGKNCARFVITKGSEYGSLKFDAEPMKNWSDFDYFAIDLTTEDDHPYVLSFELWDASSKNYATRCTFYEKTRPGRQTLLFPINRAKRNNKEGREWEELEPQDKIDLNGLTQVKLFLTPRKDGPSCWTFKLAYAEGKPYFVSRRTNRRRMDA
jgi:hypothetical protein